MTDGAALFRTALADHRAGRLDAALQGYDAVLAGDPGNADAHSNRGIALAQRGDAPAALAAFAAALAVRPGHGDAQRNRGLVLAQAGRFAEAAPAFEAALRANPRNPAPALNLGLALLQLQQFEAAMEALEHARQLAPGLAEVHLAQGTALEQMFLFEPAIVALRRALEIRPDYVEALDSLAHLEHALKRPEAALRAVERLLELRPDRLLTVQLHQRRLRELGDLRHDEAMARDTAARAGIAGSGAAPLLLMTVVDDPAAQHSAAQAAMAALGPAAPPLAPLPRGERLRIGYFSADFHEHATMFLMTEMFEAHDRDRFEVTAFSYGPASDGPSRRRLTAAVDAIVAAEAMTDAQIIAEARRRRIDIAVDLKGLTTSARIGIFRGRAAAVQVSFLGYPGTLGSPAFDWLIADRRLIPAAERPHYSEAIAWMPDCYQPNGRRREALARPARAAAGLPDSAFVFCSFNGPHKIGGEMFGAWLRILAAVPDSILWLWHDRARARAGLRAAAADAGIAADRLIFAASLAQAEHLARLGLADLFLDSFPYGAHTTASDALSQGVPIVTRAGRSFASRVATSLLHSVGLPELSTPDLADYEALAIALASDPGRLAALRARLRAAIPTAPVFDPVRFARHLESALETMDAMPCRGEVAGDFDVPALPNAMTAP